MELISKWLSNLQANSAKLGSLHVSIYADGIPANGCMPWMGRSAIEMLLEDLERIRRCFVYARSEEDQRIALNIGSISGGTSTNSVAVQASAKLYFSLPAHVSSELVKGRIRAVLKSCQMHVDLESQAALVENPQTLEDLQMANG